VVSLGIFSMVLPTETCALRSTHPLKVSTRDFSWGKDGRCVWLTTYHPCSAETSRKSGVLIYPEPLGPPRPVAGHPYFICTVRIYMPSLNTCPNKQKKEWRDFLKFICSVAVDVLNPYIINKQTMSCEVDLQCRIGRVFWR